MPLAQDTTRILASFVHEKKGQKASLEKGRGKGLGSFIGKKKISCLTSVFFCPFVDGRDLAFFLARFLASALGDLSLFPPRCHLNAAV